MKYELWGNSASEFSYLFEEQDIAKRVYLEKYDLIDGLDVSEIGILSEIYNREFLKSSSDMDIRKFLIELSRDWFTLISYCNTYVNLSDCILFNYQNRKFESMIDEYTSYAEKYIDTYDDEGNFITLVGNDFDYIKEFEIEQDSQIVVKRSDFYEEFIYTIKNSENFLVARDDMTLNVSKGLILRDCELVDYFIQD